MSEKGTERERECIWGRQQARKIAKLNWIWNLDIWSVSQHHCPEWHTRHSITKGTSWRCILTVGLVSKWLCRFSNPSRFSRPLSTSPLPGGIFQPSLVTLTDICVAVIIYFLMSFSAQTTRPPDRKSPSGHTTIMLPKPYVTHSYKLNQLPPMSMLSCALILACLWCLPADSVSICFSSYEFGFVLQFAAGCLVCYVVSTVFSLSMTSLFPSHWNVPDCKRCESVSERLGSGLWLRIDGASAPRTLSAQLLSMHGQTWWLTSPWLFL